MKKIKVLVVEDQTIVREGIVTILSFQEDIEVVGEAADGIEAMESAKKTRPDVILLDLVMPRQDGLTTIPLLRNLLPASRILVLTSFADSTRVYQAIRTGALGYMLKDTTRDQLAQAIRNVSRGQASIHPSIAMKVINDIDNPENAPSSTQPLTRREIETLRLIARGLSNQEIAETLVVHERTIAKYVSRVLNKLHLENRTQAALYAVREGLIPSYA